MQTITKQSAIVVLLVMAVLLPCLYIGVEAGGGQHSNNAGSHNARDADSLQPSYNGPFYFDDYTNNGVSTIAIGAGLPKKMQPAPAELLISFVYIGIDNASSGTHSFVEIYNPNDFAVGLTGTYALHYKSMAGSSEMKYFTPDWIKLDLAGEIPAEHSFLVNLGETGSLPGGNAQVGRLDLRDKTFDQSFVWPNGIKGYNKGVKFVLTSNQDQLPNTLANPFDGDGAGQINGYVDMFGVSGNDNTSPSVDGYETERLLANDNEAQSKQKGFARINKDSGIKYQDTDNNLRDFQQVDFRSSDLTDPTRIPRSIEDGAWGESGTIAGTFAAETLTLTPGSTERDMNFTWYSDREDASASAVQITKTSSLVNGQFPADGVITVTGTFGDASSGKSWHKAGVTALELDTEYAYRVSNDGTYFSEIYTFRTASAGNFQFIAVGDPQLANNQDSDSINPVTTTAAGWQNTLSLISQYFPDARFMAGTGDQVDTATNESQYTNYFAPEQLRSLPVAPSVGNHEGTAGNFGWHYNLPNETSGSYFGNYWYTYNNALFVVLNTAPYPANQNDLNQYIPVMDATLKAATDANPDAAWIFVQHHKSTASPASHQTDADVLVWTPAFNALMDKYGVDFVFAGHDHVYSRSWSILGGEKVEGIDYSLDNVTNPAGTIYFTLSTASGLKYYDFRTTAPGNPAWVSGNDGLYFEDKNGVRDLSGITGKPWYTNIGIQVKVPQFTVVDVTADSVTVTTYRTDTMAVIDKYTVFKTTAPAVLESISVSEYPAKTEYIIGESLDLTGMVVNAVYSDGSTKTVTGYGTDPVKGKTLDTIGTQTVTVAYIEDGMLYTTNFTITVGLPVVLECIVVSEYPVKTEYFVGESLDLTGLVVTAAYSDGSTEIVTDYIAYPAEGTVLDDIGTQVVLIAYAEDSVTMLAWFDVTVVPIPVVLECIVVSKYPVKAGYIVGESLDLTGLVVTAVYSDGSTKAIKGYAAYPSAGTVLDSVGTQTVTIAYIEDGTLYMTNFTVTVDLPPVLECIIVSEYPVKTGYIVGDLLDLTGLVVTAVYSDGSTKVVTGYGTVPSKGAVLDSIGTQTVTVAYIEDGMFCTTDFTVTVDGKSVPSGSVLSMNEEELDRENGDGGNTGDV
ncbi:MAG: bacterial Ig-like domain-containing protein [Methanomassiliicoccaceae archaeon]|nr:bacterial Ig-like domain-containing protein [Methanomassiliicoccaceae archaeon]